MNRLSKIAASVLMAALLAVPAFAAQDAKKNSGKTVTTASGLKYVDVVVGKGASPTAGKSVKVHYTGTLKTVKV
jgi:peptidylprolyl isomerase